MSSREPFLVRGVAVPPGGQDRIEIPVARLTTGEWTHLQVEVVHGAKPGPCLWLSGAIHGDELDGIEIIRQVMERVRPKRLSGTLLAVPVVNVFGFAAENRYLPDRRDLNRSFPGGARGSMASRLAKLFMAEVVDRCQYGIDFHCGSHGRDNHPHVRGDLQDEDTRRMALAFGAPVCIPGQGPDGSLRRASVKAGARVIVYEGGEAQRFTPTAIAAGVEGTLRVMEALGMVEGVAGVGDAPSIEAKKTRWVRAGRSGICRLRVSLGEEVGKGRILGAIADTMGQESKNIVAGTAGIVIGRRINPLVHLGEAVVHIAEV
ncbi:MAG: succinylglutamate desuccinylase/aspartoacylase family protein [Longimicrobiales bacterium]